MNRAAVIEQLKTTQETISKLLVLLESGETERFARYFIRRESIITASASAQTRATKPLSGKSSPPTKSRRAWAPTAISALGSTCCGFMSEESKV